MLYIRENHLNILNSEKSPKCILEKKPKTTIQLLEKWKFAWWQEMC